MRKGPDTTAQLSDAESLAELANYRMPFGTYKGTRLLDLPERYLVWFRRKGFPAGKLGRLMACVYDMKANGLDHLLDPLREQDERDLSLAIAKLSVLTCLEYVSEEGAEPAKFGLDPAYMRVIVTLRPRKGSTDPGAKVLDLLVGGPAGVRPCLLPYIPLAIHVPRHLEYCMPALSRSGQRPIALILVVAAAAISCSQNTSDRPVADALAENQLAPASRPAAPASGHPPIGVQGTVAPARPIRVVPRSRETRRESVGHSCVVSQQVLRTGQ